MSRWSRRSSLVLFLAAASVQAQLPLSPARSSGQSVTPAFEGWYKNADGSYSLSFGYYNRNTGDAVEVPIGASNFIAPGDSNQGQPTHFEPKRHWGVFAVRVPASFGRQDKVVWTLTAGGETFAIPGGLHPNWQIDALEGEAGSGNTPPVVKLDASGPEGAGPAGIVAGPIQTTVGKPTSLTVWAHASGKAIVTISRTSREGAPVVLTWFKHQGPGAVTFNPVTPRANPTDGQATTSATFSEPGDYIVRVRANDAAGVVAAGHAQCCWTNGFVKVHVTP